MKRNILSILLACLMIVSLLVLTGCKVDDLAVKVDENANKAEAAINDAATKADADVKAAAKKAADDLAAAQAKLEKLIKEGDAADTAAISAAVKDLNAAIAAMDEALTGADAALKAELSADFEVKLETATQVVQEAAATALSKATEELEAAIAEGDANTAAQLSEAIAAVAGKLANLDAIVQETAIALDDILKAELTEAIELVAKTAAENLAAAKAELDAAIVAGDAKVVADLTVAIEAAAEAAALANDALKTELTTAIADAVAALKTELTTALDAAKTELNAAIATKAEAEDLAAAIVEYKALVAAAEAAAALANDELEAELTELVNDSVAALEASIKTVADDLAKATADLNALIKTNTDDITALEASRDALETDVAALEAAIDALSGDTEADFSSLTTYIDDQIAAAKAAADVAYIVIENWDIATELIIDAIVEITTHYNTKVNPDFYYGDEYAEIIALYEAFKIRLTRAVNSEAVEAVLNAEDGYYAAVEAVDTKADVIYAVLTAEGKTVDEVLLNDAWKKAIDDAQALLAAETDADVIAFLADVQKLADDMEAKYNALVGAKIEADLINAEVKALIDMFINDGWTFAAKDKSETALKAIAAWDEAYGTANADLIDRKNVEKLNVASAEALAAYTKTAQALLDKFAIYNAEGYVFVYTTDYEAVTKLEADYTAWAADVVVRGFALDGEIEAPVAAAHTAFAAGALARANALNTANTEATAIEDAIKALTTELENFTVVRSAYQVALEDIKADAKAWIATYFAAPFNAIDGVEKANYELLDHAAVVAVEELYNDTMAEIMELAEALKAALAKLETINVFSGADIEAASAAYTAFTNWLADLAYEIEGLADTATITNTLATKTVEFKNISAVVIADYNALNVLEPADVLLSSSADIEALKTWFKDYFGIDITLADAALPEGTDKVVLNDGVNELTVDATTVADAVAAVKAFADLTAAKAEEFAALKAELEALVVKTPATDLRAAVDAALANYAEWLDGSNVPAGFDKTQFIPVDPTVLDTLKADLDALEAAVKALEDAYKALQDRIAALELDYTKITDTAAAQTLLDTLNADIKAFIANNNDVDCFTEAENQTLADAQTAIDQAVALAELLDDYNNLIASLAGIADTRVVANMTARADAAKAAAEEAVKANDEDAIDLAYANFELFAATIAKYNNALVAAGADATKAAKVYEAYVLLDERKDMALNDAITVAQQLTDELAIVEATFNAVLA